MILQVSAEISITYRVAHLLGNLGWVDFDLGSSPGWWAATVASYCPSRMVEHPKSKSTQPRSETTSVTLYRVSIQIAPRCCLHQDISCIFI